MTIIQSDNEKCKKIKSYSVFSVLRSQAEESKKKKKKKSRWNTFNLLPDEDYGELEAQTYFHKAVCMMAANDNKEQFDKLYYEVPESEVWDFIAVDSAVKYTPSE